MPVIRTGIAAGPALRALLRGSGTRRLSPRGVAVNFVSAATPAEAPAGLFAGTVDVAGGSRCA
jgi:hypothetical protein